MNFQKWQALGNDYLIVESEQLPFELTPARVKRLCEGHFGIYADGVLLRELVRLDPALEAQARVDRYLSGRGAPDRFRAVSAVAWNHGAPARTE